jgi:hypothetical protein
MISQAVNYGSDLRTQGKKRVVQIVVMKRQILQIRMKVVRGTLYHLLLPLP